MRRRGILPRSTGWSRIIGVAIQARRHAVHLHARRGRPAAPAILSARAARPCWRCSERWRSGRPSCRRASPREPCAPLPRAIMPGMKARAQWMAPFRFTSRTRSSTASQPSSCQSSKGEMAADITRASTGPSRAASVSTAARSRTSSRTASAVAICSGQRLWHRPRRPRRRGSQQTAAVAAPMPEVQP